MSSDIWSRIKEEGHSASDYISSLLKHKLLDPKTSLNSFGDRIDLSNLIIDEFGEEILANREFINLLYFKIVLPKTSLYFYKAADKITMVLGALSHHN